MLSREECESVLKTAIDCSTPGYDSNYVKINKDRVFDQMILIFHDLMIEHFSNPQIDWLKNCMGEKTFNLIFSSQEEVNKWFDRIKWHIKKCDELGRQLDLLKYNPPLKFEELKEKTWYWYEPSKSWIYLYKPLDWEPIKGLRYGERIINNSVEGYYMDFKENTLFRKQVEE